MRKLRFVVDGNLIPLARKMRVIGVDVAVFSTNSPHEMLLFCRKEQRILLTKSRTFAKFFKKYDQSFFLIEKEEGILGKVIEYFGIKPSHPRCPFCNVELSPVCHEEIKGRVPIYVLLSAEKFALCRKCGRVFWKGSHLKWLEEVVKDEVGRIEENRRNRNCEK
ncbi:Mut7-C RNAse domain-containing protein [Thermotoga sp. KOL6]|uniref:Mut7-C RNAse domain-containing protein n=1 Tax=Thermotoga sp. KOL6 TaxID=126741 RepID=UPI000C758B1A|nr:Mut7-C RNAse domain-containing protein [Thermotoga sp. KOL6]PLV60010.1 hypothetical protein AS005_01590 [Thermotoga sp. KOL6]